MVPRPLRAVARNGKLVVSWPQRSANDLLLQATTNFSPVMMWNDVTNSVYTIGTNYVTTNDITGGNSGSATLNQSLEIVGLIFDGNEEAMAGDWTYSETAGRALGTTAGQRARARALRLASR